MSYPVYIDVTDSKKIEIPLREVKRYLGYGRVEMTPEVTDIALGLMDETRRIMRPRACYTRLAVTFMNYPQMDFGFGIVESRDLWRNLSDGSLFDCTAPADGEFSGQRISDDFSSTGQRSHDELSSHEDFSSHEQCSHGEFSSSEQHFHGEFSSPGKVAECFLLAATIGPQIDVQIRRYARTSPSKSVILQAVGAAAIEAYCDLLEVRMAAEVSGEDLTLLPRFSPGYGDFSLEHQRDFFRVLDPPRRAGITLTDRLLMVPEKSVTAVIGLAKASDTENPCRQDLPASPGRCAVCSNEGCGFRIGPDS